MGLTQVTKDLITNIDPNQINSGGAALNNVLVWNGTTWVPDSIKNINSSNSIGSVLAWVNFDGHRNTSGVLAMDTTDRLIRAGCNVSSVNRNGQGEYTINFTSAFSDTNFMVIVFGSWGTAQPGRGGIVGFPNLDGFTNFVAPTTTQVRVLMNMAGVGNRDSEQGYVAIIR